MKARKFHLVDVKSGLSVLLQRGRVRLAEDRDCGTRFSRRQARRWIQQHPRRDVVAVPIGQESEVAA